MRVLLDCRMASWPGVGRYTTGLARALAAGADHHLVCVVTAGEAAPAPGLETIEARSAPISLAGLLELGRIQARVGPELTHCLHFPTPLPARGPLVVTLHDLSPQLVGGLIPSAVKRLVYRRLNARVARIADAIICPSTHSAEDVQRTFPESAGRITVVPEAADDFAAGPASTLSGSLAALTARPYLLSMGSTRAHKDLPTLLRAFARIAPAHADLGLLLVGAHRPGYVAQVLPDASADLHERIAFTGRVDDGVLRTLYAGAVAFAFPSRYEGFGLPPLEAMAMGAPVVVAAAASLPEVVGEAALLFPPGDDAALAAALERVLTDATEAARLHRAGLARAAQLTWEAAAAATAEVYRQAVGRHGG